MRQSMSVLLKLLLVKITKYQLFTKYYTNMVLFINRNLYYAGERINLGGRMKVEQFSPRRDFVVPSFFAPKKLISFIEKHHVSEFYYYFFCLYLVYYYFVVSCLVSCFNKFLKQLLFFCQ